MKRVVALILVFFISALTFTGCLRTKYVRGDEYRGFEFAQDLNAKVESDKFVFDINDVTLDFSYSLYSLENNESLEEIKDGFYYCVPSYDDYNVYLSWEYVHAVYISNNKELVFDLCQDKKTIVDYENNVNAQLLKFISFEDAFETNYGFTTERGRFLITGKINYNHSEKLTIPSALFDSSNNYVYIYVVRLIHNLDNGKYEFYDTSGYTIDIEYKLLDDYTVMLVNN